MSSNILDRPKVDEATKWSISLFSALIFFIVAAPMTYAFVQKGLTLTQDKFSSFPQKDKLEFYNYRGVTFQGLVVHSIVFALIVRATMR